MTPAALGAALWVLQVQLPSSAPCPTHFAGSRRDICRAEVLIGMKGLAACVSSWMDVIESEKRGKKKKANKFWKNPCQTIPVVGTAFSEMQMRYPLISATVLSCIINNRLVLESDKMGTSTIITHCSFCEDCHKNNCMFSLPPKTSSETNF